MGLGSLRSSPLFLFLQRLSYRAPAHASLSRTAQPSTTVRPTRPVSLLRSASPQSPIQQLAPRAVRHGTHSVHRHCPCSCSAPTTCLTSRTASRSQLTTLTDQHVTLTDLSSRRSPTSAHDAHRPAHDTHADLRSRRSQISITHKHRCPRNAATTALARPDSASGQYNIRSSSQSVTPMPCSPSTPMRLSPSKTRHGGVLRVKWVSSGPNVPILNLSILVWDPSIVDVSSLS